MDVDVDVDATRPKRPKASMVTGHAQRSASQVDTYTYYVVQFFFRNSFRQPMACTVSGGWRLEAGSCLVRDAPRRAGGLACGTYAGRRVCAMCDVRCARGRARKGLGEHGRDQLTRGVRCGAKLAARVQPFWGSRDATRGRGMQTRSDHRQRGAHCVYAAEDRDSRVGDSSSCADGSTGRQCLGVADYIHVHSARVETTCRALLRGQSSDPWRLERGRWRAPGR